MKFSPIVFAFWFVAFASGLTITNVSAQTPYSLTVNTGPLRQTWKGFGVEQLNNFVPSVVRTQMYDLIYQDLPGLNTLHFYSPSDRHHNDPPDDPLGLDYVLYRFGNRYTQTSGNPPSSALTEALARGQIDNLLYTPSHYEIPDDGQDIKNGAWPRDIPGESADDYAERVAQAVYLLRQIPYNVRVNAVSIANEPSPSVQNKPGVPVMYPDGTPSWTPTFTADVVKAIRRELDERGLFDVRIIAADSSSPQAMQGMADAIYNDPEAWKSLDATSCHNYEMLTPEKQVLRKRDKEWWMTEFSVSSSGEAAENEDKAVAPLARFLQALNHGVERWLFQQGFNAVADLSSTTGTPGAYLMAYDNATSSVVVFLRYYYFKQALSTFDLGATFRKVTSGTEGDMYVANTVSGTIPAINTAAAVNPDGSWGVGIINTTGAVHGNDIYHPSTTYNVTVTVQELASTGSKAFTIYRSKANTHFVNSGTVTFTNGVGSVTIAPKELVCLRSAAVTPAAPAVPAGLSVAASGDSYAKLTWNNTIGATDWVVKRATVSGGPYTTLGYAKTTNFKDINADFGTQYYYVVSAYNHVGASANSSEVPFTPQAVDWQNMDIGAVGLAGDGVQSGGIFTVTGAGFEIRKQADSFHFMYVPMSGDGKFVARVTGWSGVGYPLAGIMMRQKLQSQTAQAAILEPNSNSKISWAVRDSEDGSGQVTGSGTSSIPLWFKLERAGTQVTGSYSSNGTNWTEVGTMLSGLYGEVHAGLVVCSRSTSQLALATFADVALSAPPPAGVNATPSAGQIALGWPPCFGATGYVVKRSMTPGGPYTTISTPSANSHTDTSVTDGTVYYYVVSSTNSLGESVDSPEAGPVIASQNLASSASSFEATVPNPVGGQGSKTLASLRDGVKLPVGWAVSADQFDTYTSGTRPATQYYGYNFSSNKTFSKVVFQEGMHFYDGGWFNNGTLKIQVKKSRTWTDVPFVITPPYPSGTAKAAFGPSFETYTFRLNNEVGTGIRIGGTVGGSSQFVSIGELEAWGGAAITTTAIQNSGTILATVTLPNGGGNKTIGIIRDGDTWPVGDANAQHQYDTYKMGGAGPDEQSYGYTWATNKTFTKLVFKEGMHFTDGGWLKWGMLRVQVRQGGVWVNVDSKPVPAYPDANTKTAFGPSMETYTFPLNDVVGDGVRITGLAGGSNRFLSICEIEVWAK